MERIRIPWFLSTGHASTLAEPRLQEEDHTHVHTNDIQHTQVYKTLGTPTFAHTHTHTRPQCAEKEKRFKCIFVQPMMKCIRCYGKEVLCYIE